MEIYCHVASFSFSNQLFGFSKIYVEAEKIVFLMGFSSHVSVELFFQGYENLINSKQKRIDMIVMYWNKTFVNLQ